VAVIKGDRAVFGEKIDYQKSLNEFDREKHYSVCLQRRRQLKFYKIGTRNQNFAKKRRVFPPWFRQNSQCLQQKAPPGKVTADMDKLVKRVCLWQAFSTKTTKYKTFGK